jgi:hypothetical protein
VFRVPATAERSFEYMIAAGWSEGEGPKTAAAFAAYVEQAAREYNAPIAFVSAGLERK